MQIGEASTPSEGAAGLGTGEAECTTSSLPEPTALLQTLVTQLAHAVRADLASFYIYDETLTRTELAIYAGSLAETVYDTAAIQLSPREVPAEAEVLRSGRILHLTSIEEYRRWPPVNQTLRELAERGRLVSLLVPLRWEGRLIGTASLRRLRQPIPFHDQEIRLAEELCALATIAVLVHRHYFEEYRERRFLETLLDVSQAVASLPDLDQILAVIVDTVRRTLSTEAANILVFDEEGEYTAKLFHAGVTEHDRRVVQHSSVFPSSAIPVEVQLRETLQPALIAAAGFAQALGPAADLVAFLGDQRVRELLVLPLVDRGRMVGVCYTWSYREDHRFDPRAVDTAAAVLNAAAGAVTRARLQEQAERHLEELQALWEVAHTVGSSRTLGDALDQIASALRRFIRFDSAMVAEPDESQPGYLVIRWAWGNATGRIGRAVPVDGSLVGHVFKTGKGVNVADTGLDPRTYHPPHGRFVIRSVMIQPLLREGKPIAVLGLGRDAGPPFTPEEERLFAVLAQEASTAVVLIRAREALERRERAQALLAEIGEALLGARDPVAMVEAVARLAAGVVGEAVAVTLHTHIPDQVEAYATDHVDPIRHERLRGLLQRDRSRALVTWLAQGDSPRVVRCTELDKVPVEVAEHLSAVMDAAGVQVVVAEVWRVAGNARGLLAAGLAQGDSERIASARTLLQAIGERLGLAVERWQAAQAREALLRVAREFAKHSELSDLLQVIVGELSAVLPHDRFILFEADEHARRLRAVLSSEIYRQTWGDVWEVPYGQALSGAVAVTRRAELVLDARADARVRFNPREDPSVNMSLMAAPLAVQDRLLGVLLVGRIGAGRFSEHEFQTFQLFAAQAAVALWQAQQRERERSLYRASVEVLAATVDAKDPYTHDHSRKVARYARLLAEAMGCPPEEVEQIELAGLLHDVGKIGIPDHILRKPGRLDPEEWELMKAHAPLGADILAAHPALQPIVPLIRHHHERWDGKGYPDGLHGDEIPLGAAIIGLADAFDTMTSDRPYRRGMPIAAAVEELVRCSGTQFHPEVAATFRRLLEESPELAGLMAASTLQRFPMAEVTEFTVLHELGERVGQITDFNALAEVIDLTISGSLGASDLAVVLLDEASGELVVRYSRWYPHLSGRVRLRPGEGASWDVMASGQPLIIRDPQADPKLIKLGSRPFSTAILAPIVAGDQPIGTLAISRVAPADQETDERDARVLAAIGRHIGPLLRLLAHAMPSAS